MSQISTEKVVLLKMIENALFNIPITLSQDINWDEVYKLAKSQCIIALIEPAVPLEHKVKWLEATYQSEAFFVQVLYEQEELIKLFEENNIQMIILKGTAAAMYYPDPVRRTMGDIDFFVPGEYFTRAKELLKANEYNCVREDNRHIEYERNGIEFELHNKVGSKHYNDIEHIMLNGLSHAKKYSINNNEFWGLPTYENGLVLLGHIMQHIKGTGVGLRQIIDWMMFVYKEIDDEAWENHFKALARMAGLEKLAVTITYLCKKWLGLPKIITWCDGADEGLVDAILNQLFADGNFGKDRSGIDKVSIGAKREGMFLFLQHAGMKNWQMAQKHKVLRPFAWLYQIFRYARKGVGAVLRGEKVFQKNHTEMSIEEIWKRLE